MTTLTVPLADEAATMALGRQLATLVPGGLVLYLHGDLGAGKTTFARAFLGAIGVGERIKSPTYSLVEGYEVDGRPAFHLDLYRIADPGELEWLGLDALAEPGAIVLVEWPERGTGALPAADLVLNLTREGSGRSASWQAHGDRGRRVLDGLSGAVNVPDASSAG
ncbi:tRNA threonylcarbamoyladenosine biosynthesis protein TsaE [Luteibacter sp. Sphag1AF]|uniref:tRNA (adenosine(37)-N6)-threonylcarbamoyltransferase complex ATPase subunit type 1 TsaE n=1 Tax=Luteibacter sp. Sphag1AF TaxID=2587031 RepID=UPI001608DA49|nr:tRNA (adenosine(37)-N6)-threonylcarbamoyltransferase complex ATPase subunit type 1 TsaE [Luteibacter sp. Sphag1AF]MBB3227409.1 tRNA threonylcarbamoyladenosine biosynthesis protein TsaE [Luteibacter sp. Sphag1AF]